jgi:hypothetical protein
LAEDDHQLIMFGYVGFTSRSGSYRIHGRGMNLEKRLWYRGQLEEDEWTLTQAVGSAAVMDSKELGWRFQFQAVASLVTLTGRRLHRPMQPPSNEVLRALRDHKRQ